MPSFASMSNASGSIPFWFRITNVSPGLQTFAFSSRTMFVRSSTHLRSAATIFSRCSALLYMNCELISDFWYSRS